MDEESHTTDHPWAVHRMSVSREFSVEHRSLTASGIEMGRVVQGEVETYDPPQSQLSFVVPRAVSAPTVSRHYGNGWKNVTGPQLGFIDVPPVDHSNGYRLPDCAIDIFGIDMAMVTSWLEEAEFDPSLFRDLLGRPYDLPEVYGLFDRLWILSAEEPLASKIFADGAARLLIGVLLRDGAAQAEPSTMPVMDNPRMARVVEYVEEHLDGPIGVVEMAEIAALSSFHFARVFKTAMGRTPHQYVTGRRIERAKSLLTNDELSITDVALACGYSSHSHFSVEFKKHVGATPSEWRASVLD